MHMSSFDTFIYYKIITTIQLYIISDVSLLMYKNTTALFVDFLSCNFTEPN